MIFQSLFSKNKKILIGVTVVLVLLFGTGLLVYSNIFGAPQSADTAEMERFIVPQSDNTITTVQKLKDAGFIKSQWALHFALAPKTIAPGGYKISKGMNAWELAEVLTQEPYMKWVKLYEGWRKEQIADELALELHWTDAQKKVWLTDHTTTDLNKREGVYFPDTYLIPVDEPPLDVAKRLQRRFDEKFAPYAAEAIKQNIRWPTLLKIASLIQREASGPHDMPLIAGVIWNRLEIDMKLDIDASLQYMKGNAEDGWWGKVTPADKQVDSPYNIYKYKGLPPTPIANPGLDAIKAVLFPEETDCFYYLHAPDKKIYCAVTYEQHKMNIERYLR